LKHVEDYNVTYYSRIKELCIKLVIETSLYYDAQSEKHQIYLINTPGVITSYSVPRPLSEFPQGANKVANLGPPYHVLPPQQQGKDIRFFVRCRQDMRSSGILRNVEWQFLTTGKRYQFFPEV
jgi:hypothetical protein